MSPRSAPRALAGGLLVLLLAGCSLSAPGQAESGGPTKSSPIIQPSARVPGVPPGLARELAAGVPGKFLGIEADGEPESLTPLIGLAASIGRKPNLAGQYVAWGSRFDAAGATEAWNYGALYYMAWEPFSTSVQSIAAGSSDAYIRKFAKAVHALGVPVAISFGHEMNGKWYPWGTQQTTAAEFVAAWRHIHDLFAKAGATNVIWVWNPNIINPMPQVALRPYWPGSSYVNWVGLTGYFALTGPQTFSGVFGPTMREIRKFTGKPFIVAETAVETGPDEGPSTLSLVKGATHTPGVLGFIWFDFDKNGVDWRIESRPQVRADLASAVARLTLANVHQ
jgi:mannan endo-1,4-beta-mannosidase